MLMLHFDRAVAIFPSSLLFSLHLRAEKRTVWPLHNGDVWCKYRKLTTYTEEFTDIFSKYVKIIWESLSS
jgi:hypothetical protein